MNGVIVSLVIREIAPNTTIAQAPGLVGTFVVLGLSMVASHVGSWSANSMYACMSRAPDSPSAPVNAAITASGSLCLRDLTMLLAVARERGDTNAFCGFFGLKM